MRAWSRWQDLYPGATLVADSDRARHWADLVGIPFHEVRIESNVQVVTLVFSDLVMTPVTVATGDQPVSARNGIVAIVPSG